MTFPWLRNNHLSTTQNLKPKIMWGVGGGMAKEKKKNQSLQIQACAPSSQSSAVDWVELAMTRSCHLDTELCGGHSPPKDHRF